jgi:hypothetical protein
MCLLGSERVKGGRERGGKRKKEKKIYFLIFSKGKDVIVHCIVPKSEKKNQVAYRHLNFWFE